MIAADTSTAERTLVMPAPVGPLTDALFTALGEGPGTPLDVDVPASADPLADDDLQLALYVCYELHYSRIAGVEERWEWAPSLLGFRAQLEQQLEQALERCVAPSAPEGSSVGAELQLLLEADDGPPLSRYIETQASLDEFIEFVVHRSAYQLKEADPHSFAIPRLVGAPKTAMLEVQFDEYGSGRPDRMHSTLFATTMAALGLDPRYGAYVDRLPGITLATVNLTTMFALHRRLRGALVGQLAVFEMTSSVPNRRYGNGLRRLGFGAAATDFYDEHVEADAVHESIAAWDLADGLARTEPQLASQILFGASALLAVEARWAEHLLGCWQQGASSLRATV